MIEREQAKSPWGSFRCLNVRLTKMAVQVLELDLPVSTEKKISDVQDTGQSKRDTCAKFSEKVSQKEIPEDLRLLQHLGLKHSMIYLLMRLCRSVKIRLGQLIELYEKQIRSSRSPFQYIRTLITVIRPEDLSSRLDSLREEATKQQIQAEESSWIDSGWSKIIGKTFELKGKKYQALSKGPIQVFEDRGSGYIPSGYVAGEHLYKLVLAIGSGRLDVRFS